MSRTQRAPLRSTALVALASLLLLSPLAWSGTAAAGGLYVSEFATSDMGAAGSGMLAGGSGAASNFGNPATSTLAESHTLHMGLAPGVGVVKFDQDNDDPRNDGNNGGNQGGFVPLLSAGYIHKLSDRVRLGLGTFSISGAALDPKSDWVGRREVTNIQLFTLSFFPNLGVRLTDWLSVGAGPAITYATLDWKLKPGPASNLDVKFDDLDDWGVAGVVGVLLEPHEDLRLGVLYQGKTNLTLRGDTKTSGPLLGPVDTKVNLDLPQAVRGDAYWQAFEDVAFSFGAAWENWGSLKKTRVQVGTTDDERITLGFKDTYKLRAGIHYQLNEKTMLQTGVSFDSAAIPTQNRTAALPIDKQWRWGIGGTYDWKPGTRIGYAFQYTNLGESKLDNPSIKGKYKNNEVFFFLVSLDFSKLPWDGMGSF